MLSIGKSYSVNQLPAADQWLTTARATFERHVVSRVIAQNTSKVQYYVFMGERPRRDQHITF